MIQNLLDLEIGEVVEIPSDQADWLVRKLLKDIGWSSKNWEVKLASWYSTGCKVRRIGSYHYFFSNATVAFDLYYGDVRPDR